MKFLALGAKFEHVAKNRDPTTLRTDSGLAKHGHGRSHRGRIGIIAFVDQRRCSARKFEHLANAPSGGGTKVRQRQRRQSEISPGKRRRRKHRERVHRHMPSRHSDFIRDIVAKQARMDGGTFTVQRDIEQARIRLGVLAERHDARDATGLRLVAQTCELRIVDVEDRRAIRLKSREDFRLGVGNRFDSGEEFEVHWLDRGDDRKMRAHQFHQRLDLACMVHTNLEDRELRARRAPRERQRHAPMIIEGCRRGMGFALPLQHRTQRFLGRGLADRSRHRDDLCMRAGARGFRDINQTCEHVRHHQQRQAIRKMRAMRLRDHRNPTAVLQRRFDKSMPVMHIALDREISFARRDGAAIDGNAGDALGQGTDAFRLHRFRHRGNGPQGLCHATCSANAAEAAS